MNETPPSPEIPPPDERARRMARRFKFRRVNEITGAFVLVVIAVLIVAVVWTGRSQRWFKSNVSLRIVLPETGAAGIRQGSEVYFLGTLVGSVSDVIVDTTGRMAAQVNIRRDFFRFVRADSSAVVKKKFGVAGDSFFEIARGDGQPLPEQNASIVCNDQFQSALESAIEEIHHEALLALKKTTVGLEVWTKLGTDLGETRQHLDQLTVRMDKMAADIEAGKGTVGQLLTETTLSDEMKHLLAQANATMSRVQVIMTNLDSAAKNVQDGTVRLPEITGAIADEAKDLPGLVRQTQTSMREMERLMEAAQRHWLIRKYVNKTNPPPPDSSPETELAEPRPVKAKGSSH